MLVSVTTGQIGALLAQRALDMAASNVFTHFHLLRNENPSFRFLHYEMSY
jgi:hypothetical protein